MLFGRWEWLDKQDWRAARFSHKPLDDVLVPNQVQVEIGVLVIVIRKNETICLLSPRSLFSVSRSGWWMSPIK
jgi:hypothetical protein